MSLYIEVISYKWLHTAAGNGSKGVWHWLVQ